MPISIIAGGDKASGMKLALIVSRYHEFVTERLADGAVAAFEAAGGSRDDVILIRVPGAFEIPFAARQAALTRPVDAVVCLGCLIRGATPHFDFIAAAVAHGITDASAATGVPMVFGVLTTNSAEEALERAQPGSSKIGRAHV